MTTHPGPPMDLPRLPAREPDSHKGTHGTVLVVGGCAARQTRMIGAPVLTARAAIRAGAGLARLLMPEPVLDAALTMLPEATGTGLATDDTGAVVPHEASRTIDEQLGTMSERGCVAVGPGLGGGEGAQAVTLRVLQQDTHPVVVDADALNALARTPESFRDFHAPAVLTPHPGEFRRLCAGLGLRDNLGLDRSRAGACEQLAQRLARVVVLKGHETVVSDGQRTWTNTSGSPTLAVGGTGDVLTGLIAGLISQFAFVPPFALPGGRSMPPRADRPLDLYDAARVGVWVHGRAGEVWSGSRGTHAGLLAHELADLLPRIIERLRAQQGG